MTTLLDTYILDSLEKKNTPLCPVFGECGGCQYQNLSYEEELKLKETQLKNIFFTSLPIAEDLFEAIVPSPIEYHYRNRLDLKLLKTKDGQVLVGFSPEKRNRMIEVERCPIARREISEFLPELKRQAILRLTPKYRVANLVVRCGEQGGVHWGGIGRRSLELTPENYFSAEVSGKKIFYSLDTFFQANLSILSILIEQIRRFSFWESQPCLYDLYGGVGLFAVTLADCARKVVLIENNLSSVKLAHYNKNYHGLKNFEILSGTVEEHLSNLPEEKNDEKIAIVDPPRAGLSFTALEELSTSKNFSALMYLSCNPESLVRDLKIFLERGWWIEKILPFDFFPRTKHIETLVILKQLTPLK